MKIKPLNFPDSKAIDFINSAKDHIGDTEDVKIYNDSFGHQDYLDSSRDPNGSSKNGDSEGITIRSGAKHPYNFVQHFPYIVGHIVAHKMPVEQSNALSTELQLTQPSFDLSPILKNSKLSPIQQLVAEYTANMFRNWHATNSVKPIGFTEYLEKYPPDNYINKILHTTLFNHINQNPLKK